MGVCIIVPILPPFRGAGTRRAFDIQVFKVRLHFVQPEAAASTAEGWHGVSRILPENCLWPRLMPDSFPSTARDNCLTPRTYPIETLHTEAVPQYQCNIPNSFAKIMDSPRNEPQARILQTGLGSSSEAGLEGIVLLRIAQVWWCPTTRNRRQGWEDNRGPTTG